MRLSIERKPVKVNPDSKRVIARFFFNGNDRAKEVIQRVMDITEDEAFGTHELADARGGGRIDAAAGSQVEFAQHFPQAGAFDYGDARTARQVGRDEVGEGEGEWGERCVAGAGRERRHADGTASHGGALFGGELT